MARDFTEDDRDKPIVTSEGTRVGTVSNVNEGRATVERDTDQDLTDKVKDMLSWGDDDSNEVRSEHVDTYGDDEIRLRESP